jgi:hypothetical protein
MVGDQSQKPSARTGLVIFQAMDRPELRVPGRTPSASGRIETDTQRGMLSRISRKRNLRSKI